MSDVLGTFEQAVLVAILHLGDEAYGRSILKEVQARLLREVAAGAVYATLDRLESKGLATSQLGSGTPERGGRPRRFYKIDAAGLKAMSESRVAVENIWRGIRLPARGRV